MQEEPNLKKALYWEKGEGDSVTCNLCPFHCKIALGKSGICRVKENRGGELFTTAYGMTTSFSFDPIEKKPLYHFHPGSSILSVAPNSCNLSCGFCQNWQISQISQTARFVSPYELAESAKNGGAIGVAYTYSEPLMWYEYLLDAMSAVKSAGLKNVLVTNGHLENKPFKKLLPLTDAMNIDIKSMDDGFYKKVCKGKLKPVLENVKSAFGKVHLEITNLVIRGLNDSDSDFKKLVDFIAGMDKKIPLHFSKYHPAYKMEIPATGLDNLLRAKEIALEKLDFVYLGNVNMPK